MTTEQIAKVCHEANRAYCEALGDHTQLPWGAAPAWQRESAINGVMLHLSEPHLGPQASHDAWCAEKRRAGWAYGPEKDPEARLHPCLVPFEELPLEQQLKDVLFKAVIDALRPLAVDRGTEAPMAFVRGSIVIDPAIIADEGAFRAAFDRGAQSLFERMFAEWRERIR